MNTDYRRPEAIEEDISRTRASIDSTLTALENRLTPRELLDQAFEYARESGAREFVSNLQGSVKHNPLPVSLVGIGLAWLMMADRRERYSTAESSAETEHSTAVGERVAQIKASAAAARQKISDTTHAAREGATRVREGATRMREGAREQWERARSGYDHVVHEQPLALGALGLAVGALFAALLPRTRQEDELLGGARDRLAETAKTAGEQQMEKVQRIATAAGSAAADQARRENIVGSDSGRLEGSESPRAPVTPSP
jgi:Protein of unknown function (DUF3618)